METFMHPSQPITSNLQASFGASVPHHIPPNLEIPQGSEQQIQLLLLQILTQLRIQKDCSSALDQLQKEKTQWDSLEEELENKVYELKQQKRFLESTISDLQFESQQLQKGKCNVSNTWTDLTQNKLDELEKQWKEDKRHYEKMQTEWETERNEYERKLSNAQAQVFEETQKVLRTTFEMEAIRTELEKCKSSKICHNQENPGSHTLLKENIKKFFLFLKENQLDVNTTLPANKWTPLHIAAAYGDLTAIEVLLESGAYIDALDESDITPLMIASIRGNTAAVNYLIRKNATMTNKDKYGYNILHGAAYGGYADILQIVIENRYNATLNTPNNYHEYPLHMAAYHNHSAAVQVLLDSGFPVDPLDDKSRTPLHEAAERGNLEVVKLLVQHEADTTAKSSDGKIPWDYAVENGHQNVATYLLSANNVI